MSAADNEYLSVSQFSEALKAKFEADASLRFVRLRGELSNFRVYPSGHAYFSLKDDKSIISGVMWASYVSGLRFRPKDGDEVLVEGSVSIYPAQGRYQLYVRQLSLYGEGNELLKLKMLAEKLAKEGLFDQDRKRKIPDFPKAIGIITGKDSAASRDFIYNLQKRWPMADIYLFPALVQGKEAPASLLNAFYKSQEYPIDTLIIGRGGGSNEDLSAFNDEKLVRALATSKCPSISAVGHEIDFSLTDYVSDLRVSTPTAAAVAAVPDKQAVMQQIDILYQRMESLQKRKLAILKEKIAQLKKRSFFQSPEAIYLHKKERLSEFGGRLTRALNRQLDNKKAKTEAYKGRLTALSPYGVLNRGYSIFATADGRIIKSASDVKDGDTVSNRLADGIIYSTVGKEQEK
ncbi:MAG: exodeoxyribonuclease VII large subunit [Bacillota bacterium]|nr:exodeoxyribonuclease VII large subunit [Bacillota bacterium]